MRPGLGGWALVLALAGLLSDGIPSAAATSGSSAAVMWEIRDVTRTERADGRATRWDYVIQLRETRGVGIRFEKIEHVVLGPAASSAPRELRYRARLEPGGELRLTAFDWIEVYGSVPDGVGLRPGGRRVTAVRRLTGQDDDGHLVTVEIRAELGPDAGRRLPPPAVGPGLDAPPAVPVSDVRRLAGEWRGHYRNPEGFDLPLTLLIEEDGAFEIVEGDPVRSRDRGALSVRDGQIVWTRPNGSGTFALHDEGGKRVLVGRIPVTSTEPEGSEVPTRLEGPAADARVPAAVSAPPPPPRPARAPDAGGPDVRVPAGPVPAVVFRFPPEQARLSDPSTVVVADVTPGEGGTTAVLSVNGARVHEQSEAGGRGLALNVAVTLREGTNVIVVSATDAGGAVRQEVRTVVHQPAAGIEVSYRVRGSATSVNLLYRSPDGRTESKRVILPVDSAWELLFNARQGDTLEVTAETVEEPGLVTCEIIVDGRAIVHHTGESRGVPATCRGVVTTP